jgi:hypothetical protein
MRDPRDPATFLGSRVARSEKNFLVFSSGFTKKIFLTLAFWPFTRCFPLFSFFSFGGSSGPLVNYGPSLTF